MVLMRNSGSGAEPSPQREKLRIFELLAFVTGIGVAIAVTRSMLLQPYDGGDGDPIQTVPQTVRWIIAILGGVSMVGVPLLLARRTKRRTPWGPGKAAWFAHGMSAWLLWPPIAVYRTAGGGGELPWSSVCWLWGTPLMGLYMACALLAGGWFSRKGRRRARRSWREQFGLVLACLWACTGLYLLGLLYWVDLFRRS